MVDMNTKAMGNIGEAKFLCKCVELGIPIYSSFGDNERSDFIIDYKNQLLRIQVKTSERSTSEGSVVFDLTSSTMHRRNGIKHKYSLDEVDYFACYNLLTDELYLIKNQGEMSSITVRWISPRNGQKNYNKAEDLIIEKVLSIEPGK